MEKIYDLTDANLRSGLICAVNDRVSDSQFSEALTNFAAGVRSETYQNLLDYIAPAVRSPRRFEFRKGGKGEFLADADDVPRLAAISNASKFAAKSSTKKRSTRGSLSESTATKCTTALKRKRRKCLSAG